MQYRLQRLVGNRLAALRDARPIPHHLVKVALAKYEFAQPPLDGEHI